MLLHSLKHQNRGKERRKSGKDTQEYTRQLELLLDTAQKASSISEISSLLDSILELAQQMTGATASSLLMVDEEKQELRFLVAEGEAGDEVRDMNLGLATGISGWVVRNARPALINDVAQDQRFDRSVDDRTGFVTKSIIAVPFFRSRKVIGVLEVINKKDGRDFTDADLGALTEFCGSEALILLVSMMATIANNVRLHQIMIDWYKRMFETLISAIDAKDPCAQGHSKRVKELSLRTARALNLPPEELQVIELGALLHDIGKIDIHDIVLRKAGPLTETEMYTMRKHSRRGTNLLMEIPFLEKVRDVVLYHHERYDGQGYPNGLKGKAIPLRARIVAVAEAFDTMTTDRSYRDKMSFAEALEEIKKGSGTQFCPTVVDVFEEVVAQQEENSLEELLGPMDLEPLPDVREPTPLELACREVRLVIKPTEDTDAMRQFRKILEKVEDLKIQMDSRSESEGTTFIVSVPEAMDLPSLLSEIPVVTSAAEHSGKITITVKTPAAHKVFKQGFNLDWHA